jgi:hypothetical protein
MEFGARVRDPGSRGIFPVADHLNEMVSDSNIRPVYAVIHRRKIKN